MTEQKYPADIIEPVKEAVRREMRSRTYDRHAYDDDVFEEGVADIAVAALDALGLTVTEEWGARSRSSLCTYPATSAEDARTIGAPIRRTVLHAETPWVEVTDDAE